MKSWRRFGLVLGATALAMPACKPPPVSTAPANRSETASTAAEPVTLPPMSPEAPKQPDVPPTPPEPRPPPREEPPRGLVEAFPGVRVDRARRLVEFDGIVPIDCHDADAPSVFLEVMVCTPDSKEHESLVMTRARAQHVHAAMLLVGLQPGTTGSWEMRGSPPELAPVAPTGARVRVEFVVHGSDRREIVADARQWVLDSKTGKTLGEDASEAGVDWVFSGSRFVEFDGKQMYDADGVGTIVGLCTFGSETIAWGKTVSPDSQVNEPEWIANAKTVPAAGAAVTVRLRVEG